MFHLKNIRESIVMTNFYSSWFDTMERSDVWVDVKHFLWGFCSPPFTHLENLSMTFKDFGTWSVPLGISWAVRLCWCPVSFKYDIGRILYTVQNPDGPYRQYVQSPRGEPEVLGIQQVAWVYQHSNAHSVDDTHCCYHSSNAASGMNTFFFVLHHNSLDYFYLGIKGRHWALPALNHKLSPMILT